MARTPRKSKESLPLTLEAGYGGWARATWRGELVVDVCFVVDDPARLTLRLSELRIREPWVRRYRDLPALSRIEHAAHADANLRFELLQNLGKSMPDDFDSFYAAKAAIRRGMSPRYRLERPTTRRLGDDFYRAVAQAYADAVAFGMNPRKTLASDSGTPADTVARWIGKARTKGYLSPGEPGKASGTLHEEEEPDA